ncbi:SDR family oxidoreductase [Aliiroseovarius sp. F20344]|uniref:SDR family oxidoreductase n=1 Tax=Aliiroseovarius sp. F20344 TaxID=2926414 RepID=UPI001FF2F293|nr:SDR family oxidoreductase [Aliiroseovarius sp. F20344]MCK0142666.1 SDR family oxidoreductase [Aliiroseovarius sp. F20344]
MTNKCALVTGAGGRLGRALALELARHGFDVAVHYSSSAEGAAQTVAEIESTGQRAVALQADFLKLDEVKALVPQAVEALGGPLSVLVNNASIFEYDRIGTVSDDSWDRHMSSNLRAPLFLIQYFAAQAPKATTDEFGEQQSQALIVNMLDQRVQKLTPEFMTYSLAKHGLWTLTRTAAQALAPHVRVNGIGPGSTMIGERQSQEHFEAQRMGSILKRGPNPSDITSALSYLLNAPAVTGQMIAVDGGQHLGWQTPDVIGNPKKS